ncbi:hypothetical protein [Marinomonas atlantica]|uniref:hypothetical protein n=1 Tax=Marinomonas atlantica TaxID=1806668 RepID=UPI0018D39951|nr:hypothetical protein [Marinomonas atlantica]
MYELKWNGEKLLWISRTVECSHSPGHACGDSYEDYLEAVKVAKSQNICIDSVANGLDLPDSEKQSLILKAEKALMAKQRLMDEEYLMLQEAKKRRGNTEIAKVNIALHEPSQVISDALYEKLLEFPYVSIVRLAKYGMTLCQEEPNGIWYCCKTDKKTAKYAYQEKIARGFGYSGTDHWGKTKAAIRKDLLPRANELLQLASVKRMLVDAEREGKKILLVGDYVFWFEEGNGVGWVIKESNGVPSESSKKTLWKEGTIVSKNHARIVVLPYIKENGQKVTGHTKNAPNDDPAKPRHPSEYVELPFEILESDLMIGLFGELPYE